MKRSAAVLAWVFCLAGCAWGAEAQSVHMIRAVGHAVVRVAPDQATVEIVVRAQDKQLAVARRQAAQAMGAVVTAIKALKIEGVEVQTQFVRVKPLIKAPAVRTDYYSDEAEVATEAVGNHVTNSVSVTIHAKGEALASNAARVIDAALAAGATSIDGPSFEVSDDSQAKLEALEKATKDAMAKAKAIARGLGSRILTFTSASMYPPDRGAEEAGGAGDGGEPGTPVQATTVPVECTVWLEGNYDPALEP